MPNNIDRGILEGIRYATEDARISIEQAKDYLDDVLTELAEALLAIDSISTNVDVLLSDSKEEKQ